MYCTGTWSFREPGNTSPACRPWRKPTSEQVAVLRALTQSGIDNVVGPVHV